MARKKPVAKSKTEEDKNVKILQELNNAGEDGEIDTYVNETLFVNPTNGKNYVVPVGKNCIPPGLGPIMSGTPEWEASNDFKEPIPTYSKNLPFELTTDVEVSISFRKGVSLVEIAEFVEKIKNNTDPNILSLFTVRMGGVYARD